MTVYVVAQLEFTNRAAYYRYQARFMDVFRQFKGRLLAADEKPTVVEGIWEREKVVLMSFPDEAAAWTYGRSPARIVLRISTEGAEHEGSAVRQVWRDRRPAGGRRAGS